jgi:hypothetical protein
VVLVCFESGAVLGNNLVKPLDAAVTHSLIGVKVRGIVYEWKMKYTGSSGSLCLMRALRSLGYLSEEEVRMQSLPELRLIEDAVRQIDTEAGIETG